MLLILYVDDIIISGSGPAAITSIKRYLQKNLGFLHYFLGIEIAYVSRGYLLSEQKYLADLLDRATLSDPAAFVSSFVSISMELHLKLRRDDDTPLP